MKEPEYDEHGVQMGSDDGVNSPIFGRHSVKECTSASSSRLDLICSLSKTLKYAAVSWGRRGQTIDTSVCIRRDSDEPQRSAAASSASSAGIDWSGGGVSRKPPMDLMRRDSPDVRRKSIRCHVWRAAATSTAIAGLLFVAGIILRRQTESPPDLGARPRQEENGSPKVEEMSPKAAENHHPKADKMGPQTRRNLSRRVLEGSAQVGAACSSPWNSACFDRGRCVDADGLPKLSIYAHDFNCSDALSSEIMARKKPLDGYRSVPVAALKIFREIALENGILVDRAEDACIIVYAVATRSRCVSDTSEWNGGRNHLLIDFNDEPREFFSAFHNSTAMWAEVNMQSRYFRFGYDIAVPFPPKVTFGYLADISPTQRKYFATFKGQLYLSNTGVEERNAIRQLGVSANSSDVVVLESCQEMHKEHLLPENVELCQNLKEESLQHDYNDLMNTTFALVPAGRSPASYRLGEAMSAGAIPVFFHNGFVKPYPDRIPWRLCSFTFSLEDAPVVIDILRAVPKKKLFYMQGMALHVYKKYFSNGLNGIVETTLETLKDRLRFQSERVR